MTPDELKKRLRDLALRCIRLANSFPKGAVGDVIGRQLIKSATSAAANYHAACTARSHADFINKLGIVEEEADESVFWIDFAPDAGMTKHELVADLLAEGREIVSIVVASRKTAKSRRTTAGRGRRSGR